jgi:hypothetical protein
MEAFITGGILTPFDVLETIDEVDLDVKTFCLAARPAL